MKLSAALLLLSSLVSSSEATTCLEGSSNVQLIQDEALHPLPDGAFTASAGTGSTVDFTIKQTWKNAAGGISWITPVYRQEGQDFVCDTQSDKRETVLWEATNSYTAECVDNRAEVIVYVHDGQIDSTESNTNDCRGWGNDRNIATYKFLVSCSGEDLCSPTPSTDGSTSAPAASPTEEDTTTTTTTTSALSGTCLEGANGIKLVEDETAHPLPPGAFTISGGGITIDFTITQKWKNDAGGISWITPVYRQDNQDFVCDTEKDKREEVEYNVANTYSAQCVDGVADVIVYVHDGQHTTTESNTMNCAGWGNDNGIATYRFLVACEGQDLCPPETPVTPETATSPPTPAPIGAATPAPVEDAPAQCPYQTLDFTNLVNPMAHYYGQASTFQAGDYLYDQLWFSHGVKVSARIRNNDLKTQNNPYIPKFERGVGWSDSKSTQVISDPSTGGAIRLFDTLHPYGSRDEYDNPVCNAYDQSDGDPDLGAPNENCPGGGPGMGVGGGPIDPETGELNLWPNCEERGFVGIIQETDKPCPDDTAKGGFITFEFREPIEFLKLASLLDTDEGNTPDIKLFYGNGKNFTINTAETKNNGFFPAEIDTYLYQNVSMIEIEYWGSGSINSLVYPYCPYNPTPEIVLKKYAGPPGLCTAEDYSSMEDNTYTLPSTSDSWAYCYQVSIPSTSEECLYDVRMNDPAAVGGTGTEWDPLTAPAEVLCPGETVYIAGPTIPGDQAPEAMIDAIVEGTGYYSGQQVDSSDPAAVTVVEDIPETTAPVAAPTDAPIVVAATAPPVTDAPVVAPTETPVAAPTEAPIPETATAAPTETPVAAPTEAPIPETATAAPTETPVAAPTEAPIPETATAAPTKSPVVPPTEAPIPETATAAPTKSPVAPPTEAPVVVAATLPPEEGCPPELYAVNGVRIVDGSGSTVSTGADSPIKVISGDTTSVTFEVCSNTASVYTGFLESENGEYVCFETQATEQCTTYTAQCFTNEPISVVDLHLASPLEGDPATSPVPRCCHSDSTDPTSASYVFVLRCDCPAP